MAFVFSCQPGRFTGVYSANNPVTSTGGCMTRLARFTMAVFACGLVFGFRPAAAQESRGSIAGLVVDSSGGALPGVTVTIRNNGTNATVVQTTNDAGQYTAVLLLPGTYTVTVELSGFQKKEHSRHPGPRRRARAARRRRSAPATVSESVLVIGESPQLESGQRDDRPGDRQQADQRDPARRRHRLRPDAPDSRARRSSGRTRCSGRWTTTTCAA